VNRELKRIAHGKGEETEQEAAEKLQNLSFSLRFSCVAKSRGMRRLR
jgi:hypothetical protein